MRYPQISFWCVDKDGTLNLDAWKAHQDSDIPSRISKFMADIFKDFLHSSFNNSIYQSEFPLVFKLAIITPVFVKSDRTSRENYRTVSKRSIFCQISSFYGFLYSKATMWVSKRSQLTLFLVGKAKRWEKAVDKGKYFGALLTELSRALDCLPTNC